MRLGALLAGLAGASSVAASALRPRAGDFSQARPGGVKNIVISKENTLNGSYHSEKAFIVHKHSHRSLAAAPLRTKFPLKLVNNRSGVKINAYITGLDSDNRIVFVTRDNRLIYPTSGGSGVPVPINEDIGIPLGTQPGSTLEVTLPVALTSGRVYFAEGKLNFFMVKTPVGDGLVQPSAANNEDPSAGINWGFVEMTYTKDDDVYANISYVDFVGTILSMALNLRSGISKIVTRGLGPGSVAKICNGLSAQSSKDSFPWSGLCVADAAGRPLRVVSPNYYTISNPQGFARYWSQYIDQVWKKYSTSKLTIDTQTPAGKVECQVKKGLLYCGGGDNRPYTKPTAADIWSCNSGPFLVQGGDSPVHVAVIPRLCAAFVRSTLLLRGGNVQPSLPAASYYQHPTTHHYSRLVHEFEVDNKGYAFPYDDVNPNNAPDASGLLVANKPKSMSIYVGGFTE